MGNGRALSANEGPASRCFMPNLNGRELAEVLAERHPELRVVFMSGYSNDEILRRGIELGDAPFIHNPFTLETLVSSVRRSLDERRTT
jgi:two-component system, cell cycle sensor histidine kinase and response regulator CckA